MAPQDFNSPYRARILGARHVVAAGHYLATAAAHEILLAGGNAIDAGVAGGIALGVVESLDVGFGGVAPILIRSAELDRVICIAGVGVWPESVSSDALRVREHDRVPFGILQTVVPAAPSAWIRALQQFGTMTFAEVAAPAIELARNGFNVNGLMAALLKNYHENSIYPSSAAIYRPGGKLPVEGDLFKQEDLANTLQALADSERADPKLTRTEALARAHDAFYKGEIAVRMAKFQAENGGFLTRDDLAKFSAPVEKAASAPFGDVEMYSTDAWGQGPATIMALRILEKIDLRGFGHNSAEYIHAVVEAIKLANVDRYRQFGDPSFVDVPLETLFSEAYCDARRILIDPERASLTFQPGLEAPAEFPYERVVDIKGAVSRSTSVVSVVDKHGNAFTATPSEGASGDCVVPGLGFAISRRGRGSLTIPGHPAEVKPGHRPRMTNGPWMAIKPGKWVMPLCSPGSDNQQQSTLQAFLNTVLFDMPLQEAVEAPRFVTHAFPGTFEPHSKTGSLFLEGRISDKVMAGVRAKGHDATWWGDWGPNAEHSDNATVCAVRGSLEKPLIEGGADPRRPSSALGW